MSDLSECDKFSDHRRAICRGERADLSIDQINKYRIHWGLEALVSSAVHGVMHPGTVLKKNASDKANQGTSLGKYPGTNLAILLMACGIHVKDGCSCEEWIANMNAWSIDENYAHRQEIIDHLRERAKQEKMSIKKRFWTGVLIMWNGMLPMISELVDEAIWSAKDAQQKQ